MVWSTLLYFGINQDASGSLTTSLITHAERIFGVQSSNFTKQTWTMQGWSYCGKKWRGKLLKNRKGLLKITRALGLKFHWEHMDHSEHLSSTAPGKYLNQLLLGELQHAKERQTSVDQERCTHNSMAIFAPSPQKAWEWEYSRSWKTND